MYCSRLANNVPAFTAAGVRGAERSNLLEQWRKIAIAHYALAANPGARASRTACHTSATYRR